MNSRPYGKQGVTINATAHLGLPIEFDGSPTIYIDNWEEGTRSGSIIEVCIGKGIIHLSLDTSF
jgi:hypothetical protein